jgi:excinuclease UvrABC ATPase subunit
MTYCEKTDHDEFALHINFKELNEVLNCLEKRDTEDAEKLKAVIQSEIKSNEKRIFLKSRNIELCDECKGSGKVRVNIIGTYDFDIETCPVCEGKSGRVKITTITYEPLTESWQEHFAK